MRRTIPIAVALIAIAGLAAPSAGALSLQRLIAPVSACPDATETEAPAGAQESAMRCLTDFARDHDGLPILNDASELDRSALHKSGDIIRCDSFSHFACGRDPMYWMQRVGYIPARCWRAGENIAWGTGEYGSAMSIFNSWMHSQGHRENILGPYGQIGIGLRIGGLEGRPEVHVWTQHFGSHCDRSRSNSNNGSNGNGSSVHVGLSHAAALPH